MGIDGSTYRKIINKYLQIFKLRDIRKKKLGGPVILNEIDETALNHKAKANNGRSPTNETDALRTVYVDDKIIHAFVCVIPDKKA